jgi:hypothetical protein
MVTPTTVRASVPIDRNWNRVPTVIVRHTPACNGTVSSCFPSRRHISPCPDTMNQISSTVLWYTACEVCPGGRVNWARPPPGRSSNTRTEDPSGATTSGLAGSSLVAKSLLTWGQFTFVGGGELVVLEVPNRRAPATRPVYQCPRPGRPGWQTRVRSTPTRTSPVPHLGG